MGLWLSTSCCRAGSWPRGITAEPVSVLCDRSRLERHAKGPSCCGTSLRLLPAACSVASLQGHSAKQCILTTTAIAFNSHLDRSTRLASTTIHACITRLLVWSASLATKLSNCKPGSPVGTVCDAAIAAKAPSLGLTLASELAASLFPAGALLGSC
jgi:hypothetical protein